MMMQFSSRYSRNWKALEPWSLKNLAGSAVAKPGNPNRRDRWTLELVRVMRPQKSTFSASPSAILAVKGYTRISTPEWMVRTEPSPKRALIPWLCREEKSSATP